MKLPAIIAAAALALALVPLSPAIAQQPYVLTFNDSVGDPASASVAPGDFFNVTLTLTATASSNSVDYFLQILSGGSGQFQITARDLSGSPFNQPVTSNSIALQPTRARLDPRNDDNLGAALSDPNSPNGAGSFLVARLTLQALPGAVPGSYTLSTADANVGDGDFNDNPISDATFNVTVVPEPGTYMLLGMGLLLCAQRFFRRTRCAGQRM